MTTAQLGAAACPTCGATYDFSVAICPKDGTPISGWREPVTGEHDLVVGRKLGDYVVEKRVAHGGMGIVYRAVHPVIGRQAAVKVLRPEMANNPQQVERFLSEAKAISAIRHRGIVDVFSFGALPDGRQYMLMEYLEGEALDMVIARDAPLPYSTALPLMDEILDALSAAHGAGVVHRDLKPSNVFIARQSNGTRVVKLVDFGLAKQTPLGDPTAQAFARASLIAGTPEYISPEQIRGEVATARTDLYGFGVVAYEMLTKRLPFNGQTVVDTLEMHTKTIPPHVKVFRGDVPAPLDDLIFRTMAKRSEDRPSSAEAARQELQRLMREMNIDGSLQPRDAPTSPSLPSIPIYSEQLKAAAAAQRKSKLPVVAAVLVVAGLAAAGLFLVRGSPQVVLPAEPMVREIPLNPPPTPTPTPTADPSVATPPVAAVDPEQDVHAAEPLSAPGKNRGKPVAAKKRPFQELDALSDTDWRARMLRYLDANWVKLVAKYDHGGKSTATAKVFFEKAQTQVKAAKGRAARLEANATVARWESSFMK